jgi:hypothetical protein
MIARGHIDQQRRDASAVAHRGTAVKVDNVIAIEAVILRCGCEERGSGGDGTREIEAAQCFQT